MYINILVHAYAPTVYVYVYIILSRHVYFSRLDMYNVQLGDFLPDIYLAHLYTLLRRFPTLMASRHNTYIHLHIPDIYISAHIDIHVDTHDMGMQH